MSQLQYEMSGSEINSLYLKQRVTLYFAKYNIYVYLYDPIMQHPPTEVS